MESDRLFHFTWEMQQNKDPIITKFYERFFKRLDDLIGEISQRTDEQTSLMLLSDHGFITLKQEVYLNRWLWQNDYLRFTKPIPQTLHDIHPQSKAYALYPGRIFVNLKGREKKGSVNRGLEYEQLREELSKKLLQLISPEYSDRVIKEVIRGEKIYPGSKSPEANMADLFAIANDGYDLKGQLWSADLFQKTIFNGMHSFNNAFLLLKGNKRIEAATSIVDITDYIYKALSIENNEFNKPK